MLVMAHGVHLCMLGQPPIRPIRCTACLTERHPSEVTWVLVTFFKASPVTGTRVLCGIEAASDDAGGQPFCNRCLQELDLGDADTGPWNA